MKVYVYVSILGLALLLLALAVGSILITFREDGEQSEDEQ